MSRTEVKFRIRINWTSKKSARQSIWTPTPRDERDLHIQAPRCSGRRNDRIPKLLPHADEACNSDQLDPCKLGSRFEPARLRRPRLTHRPAPRPSRKTTQYGSNCRASERGGKPPAERLRSTARNDAQTSASDPGHATCRQDPIPAPTRSGRIGRKLTPFRVLRPAQKQGTNQKTRKRPHTERGGGRAAMGTSARDGAPRRLTPAPAQSAAQTAFLFATVECAAPLLWPLRKRLGAETRRARVGRE